MIGDSLQRNIDFAHAEWCKACLALRVAEVEVKKMRENYETLRLQAAEVRAALTAIDIDEALNTIEGTDEVLVTA